MIFKSELTNRGDTVSEESFDHYRDEDEPEMIPDIDAKKPEGWLDDEPELIPDPDAEIPSDW